MMQSVQFCVNHEKPGGVLSTFSIMYSQCAGSTLKINNMERQQQHVALLVHDDTQQSSTFEQDAPEDGCSWNCFVAEFL